MATKHKTALSHVNLDKAFANIRNYPDARTDRKVFKIIAEKANDEGVVRFTTRMSKRLYRVLGDDDISNSYGISNSLYRLVRKGIIKGASYSFDNFHYPHGTVTIAPAYMLHTTDNAAAVHVAKQTADTALDTAQQAADLARENADIVRSEIERLTKQKERIDRLEKHNTVVEALLAISILVGTVGIGGVVGCVMKILH